MQNYPTKVNVKLISATVLLHMWLLIIDTKSGALSCVFVCVCERERGLGVDDKLRRMISLSHVHHCTYCLGLARVICVDDLKLSCLKF